MTVPDGLNDETMLEAEMLLANNGARPFFTNETLYDNSIAYIYEQIYLLLPVLIGMAGIVILNLLLSIGITSAIMRHSEPNQLLKAN